MKAGVERARAAQFITHIIANPYQTIDRELTNRSVSPFERDLVYGAIRHYFSLRKWLSPHLKKPFRDKDLDVFHLLLVGAYQLGYSHIEAHVTVNESVAAASILRKPWAKGLVNAVLRKLATTTNKLDTERSLDHAEWFMDSVSAQYENAKEVLSALNEKAPMCIRVSTRNTNVDAYLANLTVEHEMLWQPETALLKAPVAQATLPGYQEGLVSVQDAAAQFAAELLPLRPEDRWLDACAAPGGKLFHAAEKYPRAKATALELSAPRAATIKDQAARLKIDGLDIKVADATTRDWWDGVAFAAILLDAPCSGSGTLRRNPDIKLHRKEEDIVELAKLQRQLLLNLWPLLAPGGTLLYCTCSILRQENDEIIDALLRSYLDARIERIELPTGQPTAHGWQLLPTDYRTDGFYYAKIGKVTQ